MAGETCFVIMAIGDQEYGSVKVTAKELRSKYDDLIKEAIEKARPGLEVARADDIALPGSITTDILTRIMHSDFVLADITHPNPNVFYELGLRHAVRPGTIIIKDKNGPKPPFDLAHSRYIEYENTPTGLKELSENLKQYFSFFERDRLRPDNQFLELAKLTDYEFMDYGRAEKEPPEAQFMRAVLTNPNLFELFARQQNGEEINQVEFIQTLFSHPDAATPIINALVSSGEISFSGNKSNRATRRAKK